MSRSDCRRDFGRPRRSLDAISRRQDATSIYIYIYIQPFQRPQGQTKDFDVRETGPNTSRSVRKRPISHDLRSSPKDVHRRVPIRAPTPLVERAHLSERIRISYESIDFHISPKLPFDARSSRGLKHRRERNEHTHTRVARSTATPGDATDLQVPRAPERHET